MSKAKSNKDGGFGGARRVSPSEARTSLITSFKIGRPIFMKGPMGIGKSAVIQEIVDSGEIGKAKLNDIRLGNMDLTDIRGIPFLDESDTKGRKTMAWAPPSVLPSEEEAKKYDTIVLLFDEINSAAPAIQAATYQLILDRRVGDYKLPDNVVMVAAGNRESDRGVTYKMPAPLANRFIHLEMEARYDDWEKWAVKNDISPDVIGHLKTHNQDLFAFDPIGASVAFPTPRSWAFVSQILEERKNLDYMTLGNLICGAIGEGVGIKFMASLDRHSKLPNPVDVLTGKVSTLDPSVDLSAKYSLIVSLCYKLKDSFENSKDTSKESHQKADYFVKYMMDNLAETEMVVLGIHMALDTYKIDIDPEQLKWFDEFYERFGEYIRGAIASGYAIEN